jgi:ATP-dependent Lon protease
VIPEDTLLHMIRHYTKESGVRNLEREIGTLTRKALKKLLTDKKIKSITIKPKDLEEYLGVEKYKYGQAEEKDQIGSCTGLAYTEVGGELLTIEAITIPGAGKIKATGKLGDVMKESADAAFSVVQSRASNLGIDVKELKKIDIHLHVPEGATPKDGPSAGIAIFTTVTSLLSKTPVRRDIAMTGEITLRGNVLPIGGLKEKLLAASRGGIKTVIIPKENERNLKDIPKSILSLLKIIPIATVDELLDIAFVSRPGGKGKDKK